MRTMAAGTEIPGRKPGEILLIRKPRGWTSFDVVKKVRNVMGVRKAGHAGTLDPLATGLLVIGTDSCTKELSRFLELEKEYIVRMRLGGRTASLDSDTPVMEVVPVPDMTREDILRVVSRFTGDQLQVPPMYSAVKVKGARLYKRARRGEEINRPPRCVTIHSIDLLDLAMPEMTLNVVCSKGTYIRSLVDDLGKALGTAAYVTELERRRIGTYRLEDALSLEQLPEHRTAVGVPA